MNGLTVALLEGTREAASAFLEDMEYMREIVARENTSRAELRRLSAILRRLVVERDIVLIANPRIGRVKIRTIDLRGYYKATMANNVMVFMAGEVQIFGQHMGSFCLTSVPIDEAKELDTIEKVSAKLLPDGLGPPDLDLNLNGFSSQRVMYLLGRWITRHDIIKYMCIVGSGVHSEQPSKEPDISIARLRNVLEITKGETGPHIMMHWEDANASPKEWAEFKPRKNAMDPVLIELLSTARCLTESPDLERLERTIMAELT